ncbi:MAG: hypothetical protein SGBAC_010093 [Bacillariaceae sp.]
MVRLTEADASEIPSPPLLQLSTGSTTKDPKSGHRRSSSKSTHSSELSKKKVRLAEADSSEILSPPLQESLTTTSKHSTSKHRRSSHRRSSTSKTPDSKTSKQKHLRLSEAVGSTLHPPPLCGGESPIESPGTANSIDQLTETTVEAKAAPDIDEIEAARQQGREEGRTERNQGQQPEQSLVFVATAAPRDTTAKKYAIFALVIVVIAAGVVAWQVLKGNTTDDSQVKATRFDPPTVDDCLAVSQGRAVQEQDEGTVRIFAVDITFHLAVNESSVNRAFLKAELDLRIQRYALPLIVGCAIDGPITVENNSFVVANALLELTTLGGFEDCNSNLGGLCSFVYLQMELYLKDVNVESKEVIDLIAQVFQHEGLLELLSFISPVEVIDTKRVFEVVALSSSLPSSGPSMKAEEERLPGDDSPSSGNCLAIGSGNPVDGQRDLSLQEYDISLDVMLDVVFDDLTPITRELEAALQRLLMPSLAGCIDRGRRLQGNNLIRNAFVEAEVELRSECLPESDRPCYHYVIHLDIFVPSIVSSADFTQVIKDKFLEAPLVERLGLLSPFVRITVVQALAQTPSTMPSCNFPINQSFHGTIQDTIAKSL